MKSQMNPVLDIILRWIIPFVCTGIATACIGYIKGMRIKNKEEKAKEEAERENIKLGLNALLRAEILRSCEKYLHRGYCQLYAKEALNKTYTAYHGLDGNGIVTDLYNKVMDLPTSHPDEEDSKEDQK